MYFCRIALALTALAGFAQPASALIFDFSIVPGDTLTAAQAAAFRTAADVWSANLSDPITVHVQIGFSNLPARVLGETSTTIVTESMSATNVMLQADAKDATDAQAVASLLTSTQAALAFTSAQAKAAGFVLASSTSSDGTIEFSTGFSFSTARGTDGSVAIGTYDLVGIAEHEVGHLLGFVSSLDGISGNFETVLDQFRYGSVNARSLAIGSQAYFSTDGGVTNTANFSDGSDYQASHWLTGTNGIMRPAFAPGQSSNITALDIRALDAIGYDAAPTAVAEPWSLGLFAMGGFAATCMRRLRPRRA